MILDRTPLLALCELSHFNSVSLPLLLLPDPTTLTFARNELSYASAGIVCQYICNTGPAPQVSWKTKVMMGHFDASYNMVNNLVELLGSRSECVPLTLLNPPSISLSSLLQQHLANIYTGTIPDSTP